MKLQRKLITLLGATGMALAVSAPSQADVNLNGTVSGNVTAASTYLWRGISQSDAALQGGVNYTDPQGIHAGAWTSTIYFGNELDLIVGYAGQAGAINFDAGLIIYRFSHNTIVTSIGPVDEPDTEELYIGISQGALSAQFSTSSDYGQYLEIAGTFPVKDWNMTAHFGHYSVDSDVNNPLGNEDYADYSVSFAKKLSDIDVSFMLSDTDLTNDDFRTTVSVSKDFNM